MSPRVPSVRRTKRSIAHFAGIQPAGDYDIHEDEEVIEGLSWLAYQRVATFIHLPARSFNKVEVVEHGCRQ